MGQQAVEGEQAVEELRGADGVVSFLPFPLHLAPAAYLPPLLTPPYLHPYCLPLPPPPLTVSGPLPARHG